MLVKLDKDVYAGGLLALVGSAFAWGPTPTRWAPVPAWGLVTSLWF